VLVLYLCIRINLAASFPSRICWWIKKKWGRCVIGVSFSALTQLVWWQKGRTKLFQLSFNLLPTACTGGSAIASVRLFVRPSVSTLSNRLTFDIDLLRVCVGHCYGFQVLKLKVTGQGQRGRLALGLNRWQFFFFFWRPGVNCKRKASYKQRLSVCLNIYLKSSPKSPNNPK